MFTVLFAYVGFFWACFVARDLCRGGCRQNYYLAPPDFFCLPTLLSSTQVTVIWNQRAPKAGFGAVWQFSFVYWSPWEKFPGEHHVKLWDGTKLLRFAESASSNIVLYSLFIWLNGSITLIRLRQKGTTLFAFLRWPLSLWPREQALRSQMN